MAKQQVSHKYIFKIHSARLRKARWDLTLSIADARRNDELIALNDSLMLRWIDELNGVDGTEEKVRAIKDSIRQIKKQPLLPQGRHEIKKLYAELDNLQFKPDYVDIVMDSNNDMLRACKGFKINGIKYTRLLGTSGGVKMSTIVFVSERLAPELRRRIDNGRNMDMKMIPAKFEAYRALTCSGSIPVSMPHGILVVPDCETQFKEDVIMLNDENTDEPDMQYINDYLITLIESDGYGLMLPALAQRWSGELHLDYIASGMNTRLSFEKGMVFTFDFIDFAEKVAGGQHMVKDAWGHDIDITKVELVLTTSMLKLWDSYDSIEHYLACCEENHYTFGITKTCPRWLDERRALNYQFIQSYNLTDDQISELIQPTIDKIQNIVSYDYRQALLFLGGPNMTKENVKFGAYEGHIAPQALMADPRMFDDPHIKRAMYNMLERRIVDAKIGVIDVHGNYSILCGDPYALCQSIFGMKVTGLLKAGQLYNKYWLDCGAKEVACFRAPMSAHNNIRKMEVANSEDMAYWYQYMTTCTMLNAWDSTTQALNGADKDGDLIFLTDNKILVENIQPTQAIFCVQRKGVKKIVTEQDLIQANIASFGDDIGKITNRVTSMFDVRAQFPEDSEEYKILSYRIMSGQLFQQNAIDKAKGIVCKPMPRWWYDYHAAIEKDGGMPGLNISMLADKKPYFMRYIYADLMKQYNMHVKNSDIKCGMVFRISIHGLLQMDIGERSAEQNMFLRYYYDKMPVKNNTCVMNRLCKMVENALGIDFRKSISSSAFNPSILKDETEYSYNQYYSVLQLYSDYKRRVREEVKADKLSGYDESENAATSKLNLMREFSEACDMLFTNSNQLCNILVDLCYSKEGSKQFVWDICGIDLLRRLIARNNNSISFPVRDPEGDIEFDGLRFSMCSKEVEL